MPPITEARGTLGMFGVRPTRPRTNGSDSGCTYYALQRKKGQAPTAREEDTLIMVKRRVSADKQRTYGVLW